MSDTVSDTIVIKCSGRVVEVSFDVAKMRGDVLETLEERLGESVYGWLRRLTGAISGGFRVSDFRTKDLIGLVYLGAAQADPDETWQSVSRSISPYTIEFIPTDPAAVEKARAAIAARAEFLAPDPVAPPVADPVEPMPSPTLAALDAARDGSAVEETNAA